MKKVSSDIADWIFEAFWSKGWIRSSTAKKYRIPELRDIYSFSKLRQEQLFWEFQKKDGFELVVLRPGFIYGPGGGAFPIVSVSRLVPCISTWVEATCSLCRMWRTALK